MGCVNLTIRLKIISVFQILYVKLNSLSILELLENLQMLILLLSMTIKWLYGCNCVLIVMFWVEFVLPIGNFEYNYIWDHFSSEKSQVLRHLSINWLIYCRIQFRNLMKLKTDEFPKFLLSSVFYDPFTNFCVFIREEIWRGTEGVCHYCLRCDWQ